MSYSLDIASTPCPHCGHAGLTLQREEPPEIACPACGVEYVYLPLLGWKQVMTIDRLSALLADVIEGASGGEG